MVSILNKIKESFNVQKKDGSLKGPYEASFTRDAIIVTDLQANIAEGDIIIRKLPNENDEYYYVTKVDCYSKSLGCIPPHYHIKFTQTPPSRPMEKNIQNINIHGSQNVQIGDYNAQNITNTFNELIQKIENSTASEAEKQNVKSLLKQFLSHPLVVSILGSATGALL
ncbi:hypothetical protein DPW01_09215 [Aggregatibacter aphrophilus]|uniref:RIP homotypic interaction motif-containing protein n=1 Tax=Aggregatibacter aphrophilus TaxID=732 RepID=UPI000DAEE3FE|nr:RIP homotypic interaction motif-containing protein [Aggregatibacter aphrophilus]RDE90066.1 hypothetical protein DPW01_09215 [Aggregatibacter aphrophilus]